MDEGEEEGDGGDDGDGVKSEVDVGGGEKFLGGMGGESWRGLLGGRMRWRRRRWGLGWGKVGRMGEELGGLDGEVWG